MWKSGVEAEGAAMFPFQFWLWSCRNDAGVEMTGSRHRFMISVTFRSSLSRSSLLGSITNLGEVRWVSLFWLEERRFSEVDKSANCSMALPFTSVHDRSSLGEEWLDSLRRRHVPTVEAGRLEGKEASI